jgi:hypothetical protein
MVADHQSGRYQILGTWILVRVDKLKSKICLGSPRSRLAERRLARAGLFDSVNLKTRLQKMRPSTTALEASRPRHLCKRCRLCARPSFETPDPYGTRLLRMRSEFAELFSGLTNQATNSALILRSPRAARASRRMAAQKQSSMESMAVRRGKSVRISMSSS